VILVDTSVWIDHFRARNVTLVGMLDAAEVLGHPFVLGELALGGLRQRELVLTALGDLPQASVATDPEVLAFIEHQRLYEFGIGYVDAHLLAAIRLTPGASLWTRDRRLHEAAVRLGVAAARVAG
jgi:predicted nucleic acid-binding protein